MKYKSLLQVCALLFVGLLSAGCSGGGDGIIDPEEADDGSNENGNQGYSGVVTQGSGTVNGHAYVDLGLPSGTLWATCNLGAVKPEEYGYYYAWGETAQKNKFTSSNYKWCNGTITPYTKYCTSSRSGKVDNKTELELSDDAAYAYCGGSWRMPSSQQFSELCSGCTWTWTMINFKSGCLGKSKTNGNTIFLPAAGHRNDSNKKYDGERGYYWSRSLHTSENGYGNILYFKSGSVSTSFHSRFDGCPIRAVCTAK